jgi:hypothetical protein
MRRVGELAFEVLGTPAHGSEIPLSVLEAVGHVIRPLDVDLARLVLTTAAFAESDACWDVYGTNRLGAFFRDAVPALHGDLAVRR